PFQRKHKSGSLFAFSVVSVSRKSLMPSWPGKEPSRNDCTGLKKRFGKNRLTLSSRTHRKLMSDWKRYYLPFTCYLMKDTIPSVKTRPCVKTSVLKRCGCVICLWKIN